MSDDFLLTNLAVIVSLSEVFRQLDGEDVPQMPKQLFRNERKL